MGVTVDIPIGRPNGQQGDCHKRGGQQYSRRRTLPVFTCFRLRGLICERRWRRRRRDENLESQEGGGEDEEGRFKIRNIERVEREEGEGGGRGGGEVAKYL